MPDLFLFTVIFIMPDYMGNYGEQYYVAHVKAFDPKGAVYQGRKAAAKEHGEQLNDPMDLKLVIMYPGHQQHIDYYE